MSWETNVLTQLVFNRQTYDSPYDVDEEIRINEKSIQNIVEELLVMAVSRPEDLLLHNEDKDLLSLQREVKEKIELLEECIIDNYKLTILRENFELRDGDYIKNPGRKLATKNWLVGNYILDSEDFSKEDLKTIEGD
ncbi:MAG: hypothetical protein ACI398_04085 [Clostridium sp.]